MFRKHHLHLHVIFIHEKNIVYTFLFLIMLITIITSGSLNDAFVLNANDMPIKVMFIWTFWYLICIFLSSYELIMNFQSFGQTVKGHSRDLDGKIKGKIEQARKVRAKPVGRNQLGVKMQLSLSFNRAWYSWYTRISKFLWYSTLKSVISKHGGNFSFRYLSFICKDRKSVV